MSKRRWCLVGFSAFFAALSWSQSAPESAISIEQGWTVKQKNNWYTLSQGSRLIPLAWIKVLEQADSTVLFLDPENVQKFRYIAPPPGSQSLLPLGFAVDIQSDKNFSEVTKLRWTKNQGDKQPWVGMNCAACHTGELTYQNKRMRIEGAPTLADFQGLIKALNRALVATKDDPLKWDRFAVRVLLTEDNPHNRDLLKAELGKLTKWQLRVEEANETSLEYGFARLDAFGHIFNKILLRTDAIAQVRNPSNAPVSYPFLWNIHQHDKVQWNGIAPNLKLGTLDIGALGRNVGEVTGVFADITLQPIGPAIGGYPTSANVKNLMVLENQLTTLKPPEWPAAFPPIDPVKWQRGKELFQAPNACSSCHQVLERDDLKTNFLARMAPLSGPNSIGTDPWMACNSYTYQARSGNLRFTPQKFIAGAVPIHGEIANVADLLGTSVIGSIWYKRKDVVEDIKIALLNINFFDPQTDQVALAEAAIEIFSKPAITHEKDERLKRCMTEKSEVLAYKGRPLNGIWATPPYLHNGSVPSIYHLLLPPEQRPVSFGLGTREFDPEQLGLVTEHSNPVFMTEKVRQENTFLFRARDGGGSLINGNSNLGHDYGNSRLTDTDRWALVEYMKAVGTKAPERRY